MLDTVLGLLANFFQVAFAIAAVVVFLLPHRIKEMIAGKVQSGASVTASAPWFRWLRTGSRTAHRYFQKLYGPRGRRSPLNFYGYLSDRSFRTSLQISSVYLMLGVPLYAGCAILFSSGNPNVTTPVRIYAGLFAISTGLAIALTWRRIQRTPATPPSRFKFQTLVQAGIYTVLLPCIASGLNPIQPRATSTPEGLASVWWVFPALLCLSLLYLRAILIMSRTFGYAVPIWLLAYIGISVPLVLLGINIAAGLPNSLQNRLGMDRNVGYADLAALVVILVLAHLPPTSGPRLRRAGGVAVCLALLLPLAQQALAISVFGTDFLLKPDRHGVPPLAFYLVFCTVCAIIAALVYANAVCDWASVAATRFFLLLMTRSARIRTFVAWIAADAGIAVALVVAAYVVFVGLSHLYLSASLLPVDAVLDALRSAPFEIAGVSAPKERDFWASFGTGLGGFVLLFALTALIPSAVHAMLLILFTCAKIFLPVLSIPAGWLVERYREGRAKGDDSFFRVQDAILFSALVAGLLAMYVLYKAIELSLPQSAAAEPLQNTNRQQSK